jgi:hypothetical protein
VGGGEGPRLVVFGLGAVKWDSAVGWERVWGDVGGGVWARDVCCRR